jgi:hypothetical protein
MIRLSELFEVQGIELATRPFEELLPTLADPTRFKRVEKRIAGALRNLHAV